MHAFDIEQHVTTEIFCTCTLTVSLLRALFEGLFYFIFIINIVYFLHEHKFII